MRRIQAFEWNDRAGTPRFVRDSIVEALGAGLRWGRILDGLAAPFAEFCARAGATDVLDLCSGTGEPVSIFLDALARQRRPAPRFLLSDLLPNLEAMRSVAARHPGQVRVVERPVDATRVPAELEHQARTVFNALHHFPPAVAARLLADAVASRRPVFVAEAMAGDAQSLLAIAPIMAGALLVNPLRARRDRLEKALFTWGLPLVPLAGLWDAVVSDLRIHREADLRAMVAPLAEGWRWEWVESSFFPFGRVVAFYGVPATS
jgi:hypothetical protein